MGLVNGSYNSKRATSTTTRRRLLTEGSTVDGEGSPINVKNYSGRMNRQSFRAINKKESHALSLVSTRFPAEMFTLRAGHRY
jgi:hypothetical protein